MSEMFYIKPTIHSGVLIVVVLHKISHTNKILNTLVALPKQLTLRYEPVTKPTLMEENASVFVHSMNASPEFGEQ
jgi:hypothetical protein